MDWRVRMNDTPFGKNTRQQFRPMNVLNFSASGRDSQTIPASAIWRGFTCPFPGR